MKRVLLVHFSQPGQLARAARRMVGPLVQAPDVELIEEVLRPRRPYPFPWPFWRFLDAMPESVLLEPPELEPLAVRAHEHFDLVILAYQVWYLAPSGPITAFLKSEAGRALLAALRAGRERAAAPLLAGLRAASVDPRLVFSERAGKRAFSVWSRLIRLGGPPGAAGRLPLLALFCVYPVTIVVVVVPPSLLLRRLFRS